MFEKNKAIIRRVLEEVWNKGNTSLIDEIVATDFVDHTPTGDVPGPRGFEQQVRGFRNAFPDLRFTLEDIIAEKDKVVARWTACGTHKGDLMGV